MTGSGDGSGYALGPKLRVEPAVLLAPMEGVTDRSFRSLVLDSNGPGSIGATCTEFLRVSQHPLKTARIARELGPPRKDALVGVQLMGNRPDLVAESAWNAVEAGASFVDLNFGCPAPRVFSHCAGSALLDDLPLLERMVRASVERCPVPVTAKIRAGGTDDRNLEEIARRVEQAGAAALTVHARLRIEKYSDPAPWHRLERAVAAVRLPVVGNGSADSPRAIESMFAQTGCAGVMVGRGALANPWIFRDWARHRAERKQIPKTALHIADWLQAYAEAMLAGGATQLQASGRLKQILRAMVSGGLLEDADQRLPSALRTRDPVELCEAMALFPSRPWKMQCPTP